MKYNTASSCATHPDRHLVLVDAENLSGSGAPCAVDVASTREILRTVIRDWDSAFVIVGCSHMAARTVAFSYPQARHVWRSGENGADYALIQCLETERVEERFTTITLCSGDGIFAEQLARLGGAGLYSTVVAVSGHLSRRLRLVANRVIELPPYPATAAMRVA